MSLKRRTAREKVLQALYAYELSNEPIDSIIGDIVVTVKSDEEAFKFATDLIHKIVEHSDELDVLIKQRIKNWEFNRLAVLDKIILRIGICELLFFEDIPPKVSINEAIEIARKYSTDKSDKFVNGVLDSVLDDLREAGKLKKSGRGLLDLPAGRKPKA